eukprot:2786014-Prymnesium_polylepis.1
MIAPPPPSWCSPSFSGSGPVHISFGYISRNLASQRRSMSRSREKQRWSIDCTTFSAVPPRGQ